MVDILLNRLAAIAHPQKFPAALVKRIREAAIIHEYPAGSYLLKEGQVCRGAFFLARGLARSFYYKDGKDITSRLMEEGLIITSWASYYLQEPGIENVVALEKCTTVYLDYQCIQSLYNEFPVFERVGRLQVEYSFWQLDMRTVLLQSYSASERYRQFYLQYPNLLRRIPLKWIASYLGMTEVTLSRARSEFHKRPVDKKTHRNGKPLP